MALLTSAYWAFGWLSVFAWVMTLAIITAAWFFGRRGFALGVGFFAITSALMYYVALQNFNARVFNSEMERNIQADGFGFFLLADLIVLAFAIAGSLIAISIKSRLASGTLGK